MNLLDLMVKIGVDDQVSENVETIGGKIKNGLATAAKIGTAAIGAAATGIAALTKSSIEGYAEYEQLVGGVETLFKDSAKWVEIYANNAYASAGLSANAYMETVTGFSASLLQSLDGDTKAAAEKADTAITDMADNANKMGSSMESIQNAYQGFAKQNYTMLDNLKLGYGGTKAEMERLLDDASKLAGVEFDISSYGDIVDAIHVIQGEMEISGRTAEEAAAIYERTGRIVSEQLGTTAKEADSTIQGSLASLKAAWENMVTGFISGEDWDPGILAENVVNTLETAINNIAPKISQAISGIASFADVASEAGIVPLIVNTIVNDLPSLLEAATTLVGTLGQAIIDNLPTLAEASIEIVMQLSNSLVENLPALIDGIVQVTTTIVQMLTSPDFLTQLIETALLLITTLANGLIEAIPQLVAQVPLIIGNLIAAILVELPNIITTGINLLFALIDGIVQTIPELVAAIPTLIIAFVNGVLNNLDKIILAAPQIILSLITGIIGAIPELIAAVPRVIAAIADTIRNYDWANIGRNIVEGLKNGIKQMWQSLKNWVSGLFDGLVGGVKKILGIASPSKVFAGIGGFMAEGLGVGFEDEFGAVKKSIEDNMDFGTAIVDVQANKISDGVLYGDNSVGQEYGGGINLTVVSPDGKELARFIAPYMGAQLQLVRG